MEIFIIDSRKANSVPQSLLQKFGYGKYYDKNKEKVHQFSYLMTDRILREFYKIENCSLTFQNEKPFLETKEKHFSISHSGVYIAIAFSDFNCGINIEETKPRNYEEISKRMNFESGSLREFYYNWTKYEAEYKLGEKAGSLYTTEIPKYIITAVCVNRDEKFEIYYSI